MQAVTEADKVTTEKHPRAVPLLVQLGLVFARTSRVTIAEGLYRYVSSRIRTPCRCVDVQFNFHPIKG